MCELISNSRQLAGATSVHTSTAAKRIFARPYTQSPRQTVASNGSCVSLPAKMIDVGRAACYMNLPTPFIEKAGPASSILYNSALSLNRSTTPMSSTRAGPR